MRLRCSQTILGDALWQGSRPGHKQQARKFHLNEEKLFYCGDGQTLQQTSQRSCGISSFKDPKDAFRCKRCIQPWKMLCPWSELREFGWNNIQNSLPSWTILEYLLQMHFHLQFNRSILCLPRISIRIITERFGQERTLKII